MSYRILIVALAAAGFVLATQSFAEPTTVHGTKSNQDLKTTPPRGSGPAEAINLNSSKSNIYRQGSPKGTGGSARATTVKSSKSNTSG
jgi:hypothetical protein